MVVARIIFRFIKIFVVSAFFITSFIVTYLWEKIIQVITGKIPPSRKPLLLRLYLERLHYTFIKLGQILAMRHDFLPSEYCVELMKLLDDAPAFSDKKAFRVIEKELGHPIDRLFSSFDREHISAASFGQVYRAVLPDGQKVAVKVLRPGIRPIVRSELAFLKLLTRFVDFTSILGTFHLKPFVNDFAEYTREELDYFKEARYIRKILNNPVKNPNEKIPRVYRDYSTGKVLTTEFLEGVWMNEILYAINAGDTEKLEELKNKGIDLDKVAENLMLNLLIQAFEKKYYHADPHAANICIMKNNVIGYVDFGIVGRLDRRFRENTLAYLKAYFRNDIDEAYIAFLNIVQPPDNAELKGFEIEMKELMTTWLEDVQDPAASLSERSAMRRMVREGKILRKHNLYFPEVTSRFYRLLMITDVIILQLSPNLGMIELTGAYLRELVIRDYKEKIAREDFAELFVRSTYFMLTLPKRLDKFLEQSEQLVEHSEKTIKKLPSRIAAVLGKLSFFASGALYALHSIFDVQIVYTFMEQHFNIVYILLFGGVSLLWLSRYLKSR